MINSSNNHAQPCNCRKTEDCLEGHSKKRYNYNHISSFKNKTQMNKTTLAKYVWELNRNIA